MGQIPTRKGMVEEERVREEVTPTLHQTSTIMREVLFQCGSNPQKSEIKKILSGLVGFAAGLRYRSTRTMSDSASSAFACSPGPRRGTLCRTSSNGSAVVECWLDEPVRWKRSRRNRRRWMSIGSAWSKGRNIFTEKELCLFPNCREWERRTCGSRSTFYSEDE